MVEQEKVQQNEPEPREDPQHVVDEPQVGEMSAEENTDVDVENVENAEKVVGDSILDYSDDLGPDGGANGMSLNATG